MMLTGDIERFIAEDLYPYRYPVTIALIAGCIAALFLAYRLGWHRVALRHRLITGAALVIFLVAAIPLGDYLLSPLWQRNTVCEASPIPNAGAGSEKCAAAAITATSPPTESPAGTTQPAVATTATDAPAAEFEPRVVMEGQFQGADDFHFGRGNALLIESGPGAYTLRLEEFSVRNGPDLYVILSPDPDGYDEAGLDLGSLKGTDGAFNYDLPAGTDVSRFESAVIWCRAFEVLFAHATFAPA